MFEVDKTFIDTCNKNIESISEVCLDPRPVKLHSFSNFEKYEEEWWLLFEELVRKKDNTNHDLGRAKMNIKEENSQDFFLSIPIIKSLSEHFFSKVFKSHTVVCWTSTQDDDKGTDWHFDFQPGTDIPTYLLCMNLVGDTHWKFQGYDDMYMTTGDIMCINGSIAHQVRPTGPRITIAGHSSIKNIDI